MLEPALDTRKCVRAENEHNRPAAVIEFRKRGIKNGYRPIPVRSQSKQPVGKQWQQGAPEEQLLDINPKALNTGILTAGLRCFDVDVDDAATAGLIEKLIRQRLPSAIVRRRGNSPRVMIVARAAEGEPGKRSKNGHHGKVEVLGAGQQFVAHGTHPSGATYDWENGRGPDVVPIEQLPAATEQQINDVLNECAPILGTLNSTCGAADVRKSRTDLIVSDTALPSENSLMFSKASPSRTTWQRGSNGMTGSAALSRRRRRISCGPVSTCWTTALRTHAILGCACCSLLPMPSGSDVQTHAASRESGRNEVCLGRTKAISIPLTIRIDPSPMAPRSHRYSRWRPKPA